MIKMTLLEQVPIVEIFLQVGERARAHGDSEALASLATACSRLLPLADERDATFFFVLGEYLYESSRAINDRHNENDAECDDDLINIQEQLKHARRLLATRSRT